VKRVALLASLVAFAGAVGFAVGWVQKLYETYALTEAASAAAATWVQAFGSIGAILAGFAGIILSDLFQRRAAQKKQEHSEESLRRMCLSVAQDAMDQVDMKIERLEWGVLSTKQANLAIMQEGLREAARTVETLPVYQFGPEAMSAARRMASHIRLLDQTLRDHSTITEFTEPERERTNFHLRHWTEDVRTAYNGLVLALGDEPQPSRATRPPAVHGPESV
jgi:hypothetical protein